MSLALPETLIERVRDGNVVPFVGAGVSIAVRDVHGASVFPSWRELLFSFAETLDREQRPDGDEIRRLVGETPPDYQKAALLARIGLGPRWGEALRARLDPPRKRIDGVSLDLARAVWRLTDSLVVTTNFDRVLEWACPFVDDFRGLDVVAPAELAALLKGEGARRPTVWHLHGHVGAIENLVLTEEKYDQLYGKDAQTHEAARLSLHALLASRTFLFLGFSMDDPFFVYDMKWLNEVFRGHSGPHFVMVREVERAKMEARLKGLPFETLGFDDFGLPLIHSLHDIAAYRVALATPVSKLMVLVPGKEPLPVRPGDVVLIGRGDDVTVRLPSDRTVSRHHAEIRWSGLHPIVTNLSKNRVLVNGVSVDSARLVHGDIVRIGPHDIVVSDPDRTATEKQDDQR